MKDSTRNPIWFPDIDKIIELTASSCHARVEISNDPKKVPVYHWKYPEKPWQQIHIDFAGMFLNSMWLIVVDTYLKQLEVVEMMLTSIARTVLELRTIFARWGLPEIIVSNNGPQLVSAKFEIFNKQNGI